ncbi:MAG: hypothetical protein CSYNP_03762 [Syntrophus sp. SKADARSKE-3]|nr:hypothetical protein [Syntrophus sp. SKADARSKE-3]
MIIDTIIEKAKKTRARIAIGADKDSESKVIESAEKAQNLGYAHVVIVSRQPLKTDIENITSDAPGTTLVELLKAGNVDGIVRGSLDVNPIMAAIRDNYGVKKVLRVALIKTANAPPFLFAPVGIDDAWTLSEKVRLAMLGADLMRNLGVKENIAVLGGGRASDKGRSGMTDKSIVLAEKAAESLKKKGYQATCMYILLEDAIQKYNFILAPDGISGNLIYRSLCLVGGSGGMGGPAVGTDFVYVDTSRAGVRYENAICFASALAGMKKRRNE